MKREIRKEAFLVEVAAHADLGEESMVQMVREHFRRNGPPLDPAEAVRRFGAAVRAVNDELERSGQRPLYDY